MLPLLKALLSELNMNSDAAPVLDAIANADLKKAVLSGIGQVVVYSGISNSDIISRIESQFLDDEARNNLFKSIVNGIDELLVASGQLPTLGLYFESIPGDKMGKFAQALRQQQ